MTGRNHTSAQTVSGLRTRYTPRSRVGHGFVSTAPWIDMILILVFFVFMEAKLVLQPGVVVDLPKEPFTGGIGSDLIAVVLSVASGVPGARNEIIFFEDERYIVEDRKQMARFQEALRSQAGTHAKSGFTLDADKAVRQGTLMRLLEIARRVGIERVNLATRNAEALGGDQ